MSVLIHEQSGRRTIYYPDDRHLRQYADSGPTLISIEIWPDAASAENAFRSGLVMIHTHLTPRSLTQCVTRVQDNINISGIYDSFLQARILRCETRRTLGIQTCTRRANRRSAAFFASVACSARSWGTAAAWAQSRVRHSWRGSVQRDTARLHWLATCEGRSRRPASGAALGLLKYRRQSFEDVAVELIFDNVRARRPGR